MTPLRGFRHLHPELPEDDQILKNTLFEIMLFEQQCIYIYIFKIREHCKALLLSVEFVLKRKLLDHFPLLMIIVMRHQGSHS